MVENDLTQILKSIDGALDVYRKNEGQLSVFEIALKSMLITVRFQVIDQLSREGVPSELE
jgi:hypothetical protein